MALTIREQVLAAALAKLQTITGIDGLAAEQIERNRDVAIDTFPAIVLYDGSHQVIQYFAGMKMMRQNIDVELCAAEDAPATAVNALYGAVSDALAADYTLGGIAHDVREVGMDDPALISSAAGSLGGNVVTFEIEYMQSEADATALAP